MERGAVNGVYDNTNACTVSGEAASVAGDARSPSPRVASLLRPFPEGGLPPGLSRLSEIYSARKSTMRRQHFALSYLGRRSLV